MDSKSIELLLNQVKAGEVGVDEARERLERLPISDLGFAKVDTHRAARKGVPEVIYCQGKTPDQIAEIAARIDAAGHNVLGTRCAPEVFTHVGKRLSGLTYNEQARAFFKVNDPARKGKGLILVISAGTSDIPVAEEAALTCEVLGHEVKRTWDVGVAGLHRLLEQMEELRRARVIIVAAGMEGALPSVVGGLVRAPVIAVPTSVGYGASFGGVAALLGMLNSCAGGVGVVNIDNGFGAGYLAAMINALD